MLNLKKGAFGIDISDLSLKIVKLKENKGKIQVASFGKKEIPPGLIKKGMIEKEGEVAEIMKTALAETKGEKLKTRYAVCSLPEEEAFLKVIRLPKMTEEEIAEGIKWQLEPNLPLSLEEVYFDWQEVPSQSKKFSYILIAALPKKIIDSYLLVFKKAGIMPVVFEIESQAAARSLLKGAKSLCPVIILDIGATGTGFTIFSGETVLFTSHIAISGKDFTDAIAEKLNTDVKTAEKLKIEVGLKTEFKVRIGENSAEKKKGEVFEALMPILNNLVSETQHYIDYYKSYGTIECVPDGVISKILLCGGDSLLEGLPEFLSSNLKLPVELGNPWVNILKPGQKETPQISYRESFGYAVALGLALRGLAINEI